MIRMYAKNVIENMHDNFAKFINFFPLGKVINKGNIIDKAVPPIITIKNNVSITYFNMKLKTKAKFSTEKNYAKVQ